MLWDLILASAQDSKSLKVFSAESKWKTSPPSRVKIISASGGHWTVTFMRAGRLYHTRARMMLPNNISKTYSIKSFRRVTFLEGLLNLESHQHQGRNRKNRRGTPGQLIRCMGCPCFKNLVRLLQGCKRPSLLRTYTILKNMIQSTNHPPQWSNFTAGKKLETSFSKSKFGSTKWKWKHTEQT